jgi:hypothetical protein
MQTDGQLQDMNLLAITTAEPELVHTATRLGVTMGDLGYVTVDVVRDLFKTGVTPYFYVIAPDGLVRGRGVADSRESLVKLLRAKEGVSHPSGTAAGSSA